VDFVAVVDQVIALLRQRGRVTYRTLKLQFSLDDEQLATLKDELLYSQPQVVDDAGRGLVWTGDTGTPPDLSPSSQPPVPDARQQGQTAQVAPAPVAPRSVDAERRQLTVMFCDLVDSTRLSGQLDPEDLREIVRAYQSACAEVIQRFDGHIAQLLGDGLLVYFGHPQAHEDDAKRAVQAGLGMVDAIRMLNTRLAHAHGIRLAVRVGIHTGLVVVGMMGEGRQEQLALGETPNVAARVQSLAAPDTVVISEATARLVQGYFTWQDLGTQAARGVSAPLQLYRVLQESGAQSRLDATMGRGLTPFVGREAEVTLLLERWCQVKNGLGHIVLLSGEAGIGKSRLVQVLKDQVAGESSRSIEYRCLPYYQNSALYPVIAHLQRALALHGEDTPSEKLHKLEGALAQYSLPLLQMVPLFAALLSLPLPEQYPPRTLTPQQQRQQTLEALLAWLLAEAGQQPVLFIVEDLHWIDPSTLEFLNLVVDQGPAARLYSLFTFRPDFTPLWTPRAHLTPLVLSRLSLSQAGAMVEGVTGGKALPAEVQRQIVAKTDGVPLAVEELTKMVLESGVLREQEDSYALTGPLPPLAIPATLHDALMARLDRLAPVKAVAQLGATIGRTFPYTLLQAVAPFEEATLQSGLKQLVEAELLYQHGVPPQATYLFKHALIQEVAYQSLLRGTRQQYHQRIAQVLEGQFPESLTTQPELLAQHYTEAGHTAKALHYWQRAGQQAIQRSANLEAVQHLTQGLTLLTTLPETPVRAQQELDLRISLGPALTVTQGYAAPEVEQNYARARALCAQVGDTPQLFPTLGGLSSFYSSRRELLTGRELAEWLYRLAQREAVPLPLLEAHDILGFALWLLGDYTAALRHCEEGIALIASVPQKALTFFQGDSPGMRCLGIAAIVLWCLGYPEQAVLRIQEAQTLARELDHPNSLAFAYHLAALLSQRRREAPAVQAQAEAVLTLATTHGFPIWMGYGACWRGWALAMQDAGEAGLTLLREGLTALGALGQALAQPLCLVLLAEAAGHAGQVEEARRLLAEALAAFGERGDMLTEAYRLQGELLLRQPASDAVQAEACFQKSLAVARRQQAKSWELRAATRLGRLWQQQGKRTEAYELLAPIYGWFTEGFDTADLQEAKALLEELGG
jgi:class 3 adenylate cyclase/predicted ATPase